MKKLKYHTNRKKRGVLARQYLEDVFNDPCHPLYVASDVQLAKKLNITRLTVLNIRKEMGFTGRNERVIDLLNKTETKKFTLKELSMKLGIKYQNLYKLTRRLGLHTRTDKRPIEAMIEHQRRMKK